MRGRLGSLLLLASALSLFSFFYLPAIRVESAGLYHDDGVYLVTARALAEGNGYSITSLPEAVPQIKYPPMFPALLSVGWRLSPDFPANLPLLRLVPLLAALLWMTAVYRWVRGAERGPVTAGAVVVLALASPWVLFVSTSILSETLFAVLVWGTFLAVRRIEAGGRGAGPLAAAIALTAAAIYTRSLGLVLPLAVLIQLFRVWRPGALRYGLAVAALAIPWFVWSATQHAAVPDWAGYYFSSTYGNWNVLTNFSLAEKFRILGYNAFYFLSSPGALVGYAGRPSLVLALVAAGLIGLGFWRSVRSGVRIEHLFAALYLGVLWLWPWPPARFLVVLYPLILLWGWDGIRAALGLPANTLLWRKLVAVGAAAAITAASVGTLINIRALLADRDNLFPAARCIENWSDSEALHAWLRQNTPADAILLGNLDPALHLYTGRRAARAFSANPVTLYYNFDPGREPLGPSSELVSIMESSRATYLILRPASCFQQMEFLDRQVQDLEDSRPGLLKPVFSGPGDTRVFQIDQPVAAIP
ncbi:MAG: hypothetical protein ABFS14_01635 [Gemmatimonadota bacterium]